MCPGVIQKMPESRLYGSFISDPNFTDKFDLALIIKFFRGISKPKKGMDVNAF